MATRMTHREWHGAGLHGPEAALAGAAAAVVVAVIAAAFRLPPVGILPIASLVLLLAGFVIALACRHRPAVDGRLSYRDVAGLLVFFGFAAAIISGTAAVGPVF